uniref:Receptor ligand binding region domain-containing protein n=1 Tax=Glossina austeni TaxID=7395 RepID=A0A1A9VKN1_GLOAU
MHFKDDVIAFIGPACAFALEPVARLAAYWNSPIITGMGDQPPSEGELTVTSGILGRIHKWKNESTTLATGENFIIINSNDDEVISSRRKRETIEYDEIGNRVYNVGVLMASHLDSPFDLERCGPAVDLALDVINDEFLRPHNITLRKVQAR